MSFQDVLPSTTPRYGYESIQQCLDIVEQELDRFEREEYTRSCNPYIIIYIEERDFQECFVNSGERLLTLSWDLYDYTSQATLLKMESRPHAIVASIFDPIILAWAQRAVDTLLVPTSTASVRGSTRNKRPDIFWTPRDPPGGRSTKWPTLVGEVAYSEPRGKLIQDMEFWLNESHGDVKIALTITIHARGRISIEKWKFDRLNRPRPVQKIEIVRNPAPNCPKVNGRLKIPFRDVFLCEKRGTEADLVFTESDMENIGRYVWAFQSAD
ncbi:hypothetical protein N7462_010152 [Penicillium macrosclerotiorum]|uniref:uncharacterized protein n=1 Tax=Penicillium macrosclerotiorum TaxID=303699 RepID=UPI002549294C|nr:uncharacterized protein N7462_010152 [Penicillium macrosclerotiorum]KAJ5669082.1 hypothetical protein N7462_010152 [Penicillium macrosclerotiorum]